MRIILLLVLLQALSSCSIYNSEFDCPAKKGLGCLSVSSVFDAVDDGTLDERLSENNKEDQPQKCEHTCKAESIQQEQDKDHQQPKTQQSTIWFKGYKDEKGKTHKEHEIQF